MGYYDHEPETIAQGERSAPPASVFGTIQGLLNVLIRLLGLGLIVVGLGIGVSVVLEAWALYKAPERIERFAAAIERGSNIDLAFRSVAQEAANEVNAEEGQSGTADRPAAGGKFRLSYFAAWAVVLVLMLVVGTLAMSAAATGARLALSRPEG